MKPNKSRDVLTRHERRPAWKCYFHNQEEPPQSVERPVRHRKQLWTCHDLAGSFRTSIFLRWHRSTSRTVQGKATLRRKPEPGAASTCKKSSPTTWTTLNPGILRPKDRKASRWRLLSWIQSRSTFDIKSLIVLTSPSCPSRSIFGPSSGIKRLWTVMGLSHLPKTVRSRLSKQPMQHIPLKGETLPMLAFQRFQYSKESIGAWKLVFNT